MRERVDWCSEICRQLDMLSADIARVGTRVKGLPSDHSIEAVKTTLERLRLMTDSNISVPFLWLAPQGEIGLTWQKEGKTLDVIFGSEFIVRLSLKKKQQKFAAKDLANLLSEMEGG